MVKAKHTWRERLHEIIYETETKEGKLFDVILLIMIVSSILLVMLESVPSISAKFQEELNIAEWAVTILFSLEYIARLVVVKKPWKYALSFFGIVDFLSTIPKYLSLVFGGSHFLVTVRALRLLRIFRVLKLVRYVRAANQLGAALRASKAKISVFLIFVLIVCFILGTVMYLVEGPENGFTSIPRSVYWAIVTLTTVGFGDIAPHTALGQFIATVVMILGYAIIAIPTGVIAQEVRKQDTMLNNQLCRNCHADHHRDDAEFCYSCGFGLHLENNSGEVDQADNVLEDKNTLRNGK